MRRNRLVRFLVVGSANTALSYAVYAGLLWIGLGYAVASFLALVAGILVGFWTQGTFVFGNRDRRRLGRFVLMWFAIYVVNVELIRRLIDQGLDAYWAGAVALVPITALSYVLQRYFVFWRSTDGS